MASDEFDFVALGDLRVGLFVDLDLGWLAHPFSTSRFKIVNERQIESLRGLGVERIRYVPSRSDALQGSTVAATAQQASTVQATPTKPSVNALDNGNGFRARAQHCERRFAETAHQYRKTLDLLDSRPLEAASVCQRSVQSLTADLQQQGDVALRLLAEASGDKSALHPVNVSVISLLLGRALGVQGAALDDLGVAALLHDIGKSRLPERTRRMDTSFSVAEQKAYQNHVALGVEMAHGMGLSEAAVTAIEQHHELADGSGFPQHLKGDEIALNARILALVNRYDGLCNPAKIGAAMTPHEALAAIFAQQKTRFDGPVLSAFIRMMGVYPPGSVVQLSDERHAMVVSVNSLRPLMPCVIVHEPSVPRHEAVVMDLMYAPNTSIRRSLKPSSLPAPALDYLQPRQRMSYFYDFTAQALEDAQPA